MKVLLTVNVDYLEIDQEELIGFQIFSFGDVYLKYEISITDAQKYSNKQKYLSKEISLLKENIIVVGNPCYNLEDISNLNNELQKYNLSLTTVYIPSEQRIEKRKQKAIEEQKRWGYRDGVSDEEIERNFENFRITLLEIKNGFENTSIIVEEV